MSNQSTTAEQGKPSLSHINQKGEANMVDVTEKAITSRTATAEGRISMSADTIKLITEGDNKKGDVFSVARIAGIQAAKKCSDLIPLCHPLMLTKVKVDFEVDHQKNEVKVTSLCKLAGQTGVEMEALTAVSVTCLTLFDMCKAADPFMEIHGIKVLSKEGGKSGSWEAKKGNAVMSEQSSIKVIFFAALREQLECNELTLPVSTPITVKQATQEIIAQHPDWESILTNDSLFTAVNHNIVDDSFTVNPNDELAFFPPVTGG